MAENSMRDAILSVVEAKGGSAEGVGPLDRDALDRLLDVMAGSDQPVTSGMSDAQVVRALAQYAHGGGGGGGGTQTITVTKAADSDTVEVSIISWSDYIAGTPTPVEIQPDSAEGLTNVYSVPVGSAYGVYGSDNNPIRMYLDAEMTKPIGGLVMPSTPLYASTAR